MRRIDVGQLQERSTQGPLGRRIGGLILVVAVVVLAAAIGIILSAAIDRIRNGPTAQGVGQSAGTSQFSQDGLSFTPPGGWKTNAVNLQLHYQTVLAYVGSGGGSMTCGSDFIPGLGGTCNEHFDLTPNSVSLKVSVAQGPPTPQGPVAWSLANDPGSASIKVGGQPATVRTISDSSSGADEVIQWIIGDPSNALGSYQITAFIKGPDINGVRGQVDAVIQTITIGP